MVRVARHGLALSAVVLGLVYGCSSSNPADNPGGGGADGGVSADGSVAENTFAACTDKLDNDGDGKIDCEDSDCLPFAVCGGSITPDGGPRPCAGCDDQLSCTIDGCDDAGKCTHAVRTGTCLINNQCYSEGQKNGSQCQICDSAANKSGWTTIVGGCTIGGVCYKKGERDSSGCYLCDPARDALNWTPVANPACTVGGRCYLDGEKDTSGCEMCNPAVSKTTLSPAPYKCQISGQCYEEGAKHPNAVCTSVTCNSSVSTTAWTIAGNECLVGSTCYAAGQKSSNGCTQCIPSQSKTSLTNTSYACQISGSCYQAGDPHPSGSCTSTTCDPTKSTTTWSTAGNECLIGGYCRQAGDKTSSGCSQCNPAQSKTSWSSVTGGCNISGACYTNAQAHPSATCSTVTCNTAMSTSSWTIAGNECLIGGQCYAAGAVQAGTCQICNPATSKTTWSTAANSCTIAGQCYVNGTAHPSATCSSYGVSCQGATNSTNWTVTGNGCAIGGQCYAAGATDPTGCARCDPSVSKTSWTPLATCGKILFAGLNEARTGAMGGVGNADAACALQAAAAGYGGTWRAFLSATGRNVKEFITGTAATTIPVMNLRNEQLFANWDAAFSTSTSAYVQWASPYSIYLFNGVPMGYSITSYAYFFNGSQSNGTVYPGYTCSDWTTNSSSSYGIAGRWSSRYIHYANTTYNCNYALPVGCFAAPY